MCKMHSFTIRKVRKLSLFESSSWFSFVWNMYMQNSFCSACVKCIHSPLEKSENYHCLSPNIGSVLYATCLYCTACLTSTLHHYKCQNIINAWVLILFQLSMKHIHAKFLFCRACVKCVPSPLEKSENYQCLSRKPCWILYKTCSHCTAGLKSTTLPLEVS